MYLIVFNKTNNYQVALVFAFCYKINWVTNKSNRDSINYLKEFYVPKQNLHIDLIHQTEASLRRPEGASLELIQ